jgi:HlyD family secretion protein
LWLTLLLTASSCRDKGSEPQVKTALIRRGDLTVTVSAPGRMAPAKAVTIKSRAAGEVREILVEEGDSVGEDDVLIRLDPEVENARLEQAKAEYQAARASVRQAKAQLGQEQAEYKRSQQLYKEGYLSESDYERKKSSLSVTKSSLEIAKSREQAARHGLTEARDRLSYTGIRAPMKGVILNLGVSKGQVVSSGATGLDTGTPLLTIADLSRLKVTAEVEETDVAQVAPGQEAGVEVDAFPGTTFPARVTRVSPEAVKKGAVTVIGVELELLEKAPGLRPGMSATVEIITLKAENALLAPVSAVLTREGPGVVVVKDGATEWRPLKLGPGDWEMVVVEDGLSVGEKVILPPGAYVP